MQRQRYASDRDEGDGTAFPGFGMVVGLLLFLLIIGMIGWSTQPTQVAYPHKWQRYEMDEDDEDWEEYYEPGPNGQGVKSKPGVLRTSTLLSKKAQDVVKKVIGKKIEKRQQPKPILKPVAKLFTMKAPPPKAEGYEKAKDKKKVSIAEEIRPIKVSEIR